MNNAPKFVSDFLNYQLKEVERIYKGDTENIKAIQDFLNKAVINYNRGLLTLHEVMEILNNII